MQDSFLFNIYIDTSIPPPIYIYICISISISIIEGVSSTHRVFATCIHGLFKLQIADLENKQDVLTIASWLKAYVISQQRLFQQRLSSPLARGARPATRDRPPAVAQLVGRLAKTAGGVEKTAGAVCYSTPTVVL